MNKLLQVATVAAFLQTGALAGGNHWLDLAQSPATQPAWVFETGHSRSTETAEPRHNAPAAVEPLRTGLHANSDRIKQLLEEVKSLAAEGKPLPRETIDKIGELSKEFSKLNEEAPDSKEKFSGPIILKLDPIPSWAPPKGSVSHFFNGVEYWIIPLGGETAQRTSSAIERNFNNVAKAQWKPLTQPAQKPLSPAEVELLNTRHPDGGALIMPPLVRKAETKK